MEDNNKCPQCNSPLMFKRERYESPEGSTEVFVVLDGLCVNPKCANYAGIDLNNPLKVATIVRNKVN